nr:hypothetical protein [Bacillus thuringiensis]
MKYILEAIYEPNFSENSHGFRKNRGCHTALKQIKRVVMELNGLLKVIFKVSLTISTTIS